MSRPVPARRPREPAETLRIALAGIAANKLRSGLTILGMTIGVAAVIVLVAVGNGSKRKVQAGIDALGSNVLIVQAQNGPGGARRPALRRRGRRADADHEDATALQDEFNAPDVKTAAPVVNATGTTLVAGLDELPALVGRRDSTPAYATTRDYQIAAGAVFTAQDVKQAPPGGDPRPDRRGQPVRRPGPVGQSVRIDGTGFEVVGVTKPKGSNGVQDQDDVAIAPITAVQDAISGYGSISNITVQGRSAGTLDAAQAEVTSILEQRHHDHRHHRPGLPGHQPGLGARGVQPEHPGLHHPARRRRRDLAARRRDRRHEHHARERHRAHPRDRDPQGDRRAAGGHPHAVPDRGRARVGLRRPARRRRRHRRQPVHDRRRHAGDRPVLGLPGLRRRRRCAACSSAPTRRRARPRCARSTPSDSNDQSRTGDERCPTATTASSTSTTSRRLRGRLGAGRRGGGALPPRRRRRLVTPASVALGGGAHRRAGLHRRRRGAEGRRPTAAAARRRAARGGPGGAGRRRGRRGGAARGGFAGRRRRPEQRDRRVGGQQARQHALRQGQRRQHDPRQDDEPLEDQPHRDRQRRRHPSRRHRRRPGDEELERDDHGDADQRDVVGRDERPRRAVRRRRGLRGFGGGGGGGAGGGAGGAQAAPPQGSGG